MPMTAACDRIATDRGDRRRRCVVMLWLAKLQLEVHSTFNRRINM